MTVESFDKIRLEPLAVQSTVKLFLEKAQLSLARVPSEKRAFNEAFTNFIVSDYHFQNSKKEDS